VDLVSLFLATATAAYGVWYVTLAREFTARQAYCGCVKYRYTPRTWQGIMVSTVSLLIFIAGVAEIARMWKSN
jgi:hypothetical protein